MLPDDRSVDKPINRGRDSANQPIGAGHNGLEHRLYVVRRTGDDLQYLGRRRLLLAGFLQVFARTGDRTTLNSGGRWRNAGAWSWWSCGPLLGLRCGLSPRSSCRPFLMAAPYTPPGSRRASYRARPSFWKRQISQGRLANWPVRRRLRVQSRKCSCLHGTSVVPSKAQRLALMLVAIAVMAIGILE